MKDKLKEQYLIIMNDFNFKEIHEVMTFLRWEWKPTNQPAAIPSVDAIKQVASDCLERVIDSEEDSVTATMGPFEAQKIQNTLELTFILQRVNPLGTLLNPGETDELARKA